ncbi:potassium channel, subfamily K, member 16-like [Aplochiton taeniatus]
MQCRFPRVPSILLLGLVYMAYVLIGGAVFWKLEGDVVQQDVSQLLEKQVQLLRGYPCIDQDGLEALAEMIISASKAGLSLKGNFTRDGFGKFTSSAVFAATVVTTIGYGNISPSTTYGQIFCVLFMLIGIALNVMVLNRVGECMLTIQRSACDFVERKTNRKKCSRYLIRLVTYLSGAGLLFVMPVIVFKYNEGWTYSLAIYYCFITISTIGFGHYVAGPSVSAGLLVAPLMAASPAPPPPSGPPPLMAVPPPMPPPLPACGGPPGAPPGAKLLPSAAAALAGAKLRKVQRDESSPPGSGGSKNDSNRSSGGSAGSGGGGEGLMQEMNALLARRRKASEKPEEDDYNARGPGQQNSDAVKKPWKRSNPADRSSLVSRSVV